MDELMDKFSRLDAMQTLWIVGGVAAIFVGVVIYDALRQRRANSPSTNRRRRHANKNRTRPVPPPASPLARQNADDP